MARVRLALTVATAISALLGAGPAWSDSPVAPLNGTVLFTSASAPSDTLYVNAGNLTIVATAAHKFQGDPDSKITVVGDPGSGNVHVADVTNRDGDSLYRVRGRYVVQASEGPGGPGSGWNAEYDRGAGRVVLYVNSGAEGDDYIGMLGPQVASGRLTVTLANVTPTDGGYLVTASKQSGDGDIGFLAGNSCTLGKTGGQDFYVIPLTGVTAGELTIQGTATGLTTGVTDAFVTSVSVTFNPSPVITGFTLASGTTQITNITDATVNPSEDTVSIDISINNSARANLVSAIVNDWGYQCTVAGLTATPANAPQGDAFIEARYHGALVGRAPIVVVVPWSLSPTSTPGFVAVPGVNQAANSTTSPTYGGALAPGAVHLWTYYVTWQTITVLDQFGNTLNSIYQGSPVSEAGGIGINQYLSAAGTYLDPVGVLTNAPPPNNLQSTDPRVAAFLAGTPLPLVPVTGMQQNIQVQVAGQAMHPGVRSRTVSAQAPNLISVQWAAP
jgi:hypothetical protein